ncbi:MAG TPA: IclR family transcriptional regulator [Chloroflexota bacterium]|nr:IclR family transcriptional regulator [Chloroflexota bacterium]
MDGEEARKPAYPVGAVDNALRLLLLFRERKRLRVSDAARTLGVASSTAHRLLDTLRYHGFVQQDAESRAYEAGPALTELGLAAVRELDLRTWAHPHMEALSEAVGETVHLLVLRGRDVLFVDAVEGADPLRVTSRIGSIVPAHLTAGGRLLLAELPSEELARRFKGVSRLTGSKTLSTLTDLKRMLDCLRRQGYSVNMGDTLKEPHTAAVAALVRESSGRAVASLSIAAPLARLEGQDLTEVVERLQAAAEAVSRELP